MDDLQIFDLDTGILYEPSEKDYIHEEVYADFWGALQPVNWVYNRRSHIQNQNAQKETYYACPIFGLTHAINELNAMEWEKVGEVRTELSGLENTKAIVTGNERWFRPTMGGTMNGMLDYSKKRGWIDGYTLVRKVGNDNGDRMRKALDDGFILYTGSSNIDWKETANTPGFFIKMNKKYGHIFCIDGYTDDYFHIRQSVGTNFFDNGYAYIKDDQLPVLFWVYAITDHDDTNELYDFKAVKLGIYNGKDPKKIATRLELSTMEARASNKGLSEITSGDRPNDIPTDLEIHLMTERAFGKASSTPIRTRREIAAYCARNYVKR